ncbi:CoxG family protein [Portibacter marinus]|uniref:CoxG family protein n=1 Tax=Portibacter marinus TaxID=2898660 RepID=UPI001F2E96B3|nr:carbon monoxide dehydrogenase subunit G [Portibacter marinus]
MQLNGEHVLKAPRKVVWDMLMDPDQLVKITPGISELNKIDKTNYEAISEIKIGPVKGRFTGAVELKDMIEPEQFTMVVSQNSKIGNVKANVDIHLDKVGNGQTRLTFDGKAQMSGLLARTGSRVVSGVANSLTKQFFDSFEKEIELMNS